MPIWLRSPGLGGGLRAQFGFGPFDPGLPGGRRRLVAGDGVTGRWQTRHMARTIDAAIAERAARQLGLVTLEDCRLLGLTDAQRQHRLRTGRWAPVGHRTFRIRGAPVTWAQRLYAACLEAGQGAVVSHIAAAAWWGFPRISEGAVEISVPRSRSARSTLAVVHRPRAPVDSHATMHRGLPVTTPERTLVDIAGRVTLSLLESCLDDSLRRGLVHPERLNGVVSAMRSRGRPGVRRLQELAAVPVEVGRRASWLEREFVRLAQQHGVPLPRLQAPIEVRGRIYFADGLYDWASIVIELDGHGSHATRRERQHDAERTAHFMELGLRVLRFTYEDVIERPRYVADTILRHLAAARSGRETRPTAV